MTVDELKRDKAKWVAAAQAEQERQARARRAQWTDIEIERDTARQTLAAYDAVRKGVPVYAAALEVAEPAVRLYAAHLLAWFPEERKTTTPALTRLLATEREPVVSATACVAAGLCGAKDDPGLVEQVSARWRSTHRGERWSAAIGLARLQTSPDRSVIEDVYGCLFEANGTVPHWPFLGGDMAIMAALTVRGLGPQAADRVDILVDRLTAAHPATDEFLLLRALLDAVFPQGPIDDDAAFTDLDAEQRRAVLALWQTRALSKGAMIAMLMTRYNLPDDEAALQAWCDLPPRN